MLIEIDTDTLVKNGITAHQFLIAQLLHERRFEFLTEYLESTYSFEKFEHDVSVLVGAEFLIVPGLPYDFEKLVVRPEFISLISKGDFFEELVALYPAKVYRVDNTYDLLRTDLGRCRQIYARITLGSKVKHDHVMKCLKYELEYRSNTDGLKYMRRLPKWLSSEGWKSYEERMEDNSFSVRSLEGDEEYGQEIE